MSYSIKHLFHIGSTKQDVFKALSTIEGLSSRWTIQTEGTTVLGGSIQFDFGTFKGPKMKIIEFVPNEKIVWECMGSEHGWEGHTFIFSLDENDNKTRVRFSHNGWEEQNDFYAGCSFSWGRYLESLRQLCQTGEGNAFGSKNYK